MSKRRRQKTPSSRPVNTRPRHTTTAPTPGWEEVMASLAARTDAGPRRTVEPAAKPLPARRVEQTAAAAARPAEPTPKTPRPGAAGGSAKISTHLEPQSVAATYWIDTESWIGPEEIAVRFTGTQIDPAENSAAGTFERIEQIADIAADTGRIAVTTHQEVPAHGSWQVTATPLPVTTGTAAGPARGGVRMPAASTEVVQSRFSALAQGPGVHVFSWPALVAFGALIAIVIHALLLARAGLPVWGPVLTDLAASVVGVFGARLWALALHRKPLRKILEAGACIQGFLAGAFLTMVIGALLQQLPVGAVFDALTPGLFFGMAVGRPGCFFTGCCYGRPTPSRWGLWSSDRRTARRRHPVQLYEAAAALIIGLASLAMLYAAPAALFPGAVFIISVMAYTIARQQLFPLRTESRTRKGRAVTVASGILIILATLTAGLLL